jgi:hypothetical protein
MSSTNLINYEIPTERRDQKNKGGFFGFIFTARLPISIAVESYPNQTWFSDESQMETPRKLVQCDLLIQKTHENQKMCRGSELN